MISAAPNPERPSVHLSTAAIEAAYQAESRLTCYGNLSALLDVKQLPLTFVWNPNRPIRHRLYRVILHVLLQSKHLP